MNFHLDAQRKCNTHRTHLSGKAGAIPIHSFFKKLEEPSLDEGFDEVKVIDFCPIFSND
jgi:hypothetical protein